MASFSNHDMRRALARLKRPLALTRAGMIAETLVRSLWPLTTVVLLVLAALMLGLHETLPLEAVWGIAGLAGLVGLWSLYYAVRTWSWPSRAEAEARLDATLAGRPIQALNDVQAIGDGDEASAAVWRAHKARMAERAGQASAVAPDLRVSGRDPYALRYVAALAFLVALLFGSIWRVGTVGELAAGTTDLAGGPVWEGWIEPPVYTGKPTLYLNDQDAGILEVPQGALVTLRMYGEVGALQLRETVSGRGVERPDASDPAQSLKVTQSGELRIEGPNGRAWTIEMIEDETPTIVMNETPDSAPNGQIEIGFVAEDDFAIESGTVEITLDMEAIDRRYGLALDPEPVEPIKMPLPLPITGDRWSFEGAVLEDFSEHPWANLPVKIEMTASDALEQTGVAEPLHYRLIARRFFDPLAAAVIEQRRYLLWNRDNAADIAQMLRAISHRPDDVFRSETAYLRLRTILRRVEALAPYGLSDEHRDELSQAMWDLALLLEDGSLADAAERLRRAQERLTTDDYMRQLAEQQRNNETGQFAEADPNSMQMSQNDLQEMMDRIQELMEQGRMAEAEQALREYQELLENMQITQGQQGEGGQSPGQQAMDGLAETLRDQQGLSDEAFRDLQEQFNPDAQAGESQQNEGRNGGQGRGQSHEGQPQGEGQGQGQGQGDQQQGEGGQQQGQQGQQGQGQGDQQSTEQSLADRQQALRDELNRQAGNLPGAGTPEGDAARDALERAGRAMEGAEDALREDDYAEAIDQQSQAMEALRDGIQNLGEAMAEQQQNQPGQGTGEGDTQSANRDPLGRNQDGNSGALGSEEGGLAGEDVYRRARELLDEIRRRAGEGERPEAELEYLRRLLENF